MGVEYVNRRGERYYLFQGKTKTGKPKYYVSRKPGGVSVDQVPEGFEIYENPERGIVSVRKIRPSPVLPVEREQLTRWTRELAGTRAFLVDVQGDSLVIYTSSVDPAASVSLLSKLFGSLPGMAAAEEDWIGRHAHYTAMMRFTLVDEERRLFSADRWCFRGAIDDWWPLAHSQPLETLAHEFLPHLNRESFYELM